MNDTDNPLSETHYQEIQRGLEAAQRGLANIARAKMAGIDMSAAEQQIKDSQARLLAIKQVYFPGR